MSYEKEDISYPCSATNAKARAREKENQESKKTNTHTYHELIHLAMHVHHLRSHFSLVLVKTNTSRDG
jgi:hypothetical protein